MNRHTLFLPAALFTLAFADVATAQFVLATTNTATDTIVTFSPFDGSLVSTDLFAVQNTVQTSAIAVGTEVWVSEQTGDRVVRYDHGGNILGVIGPTFAGGGLDNIRGLTLIGSTVYVANDGALNGATADSLVLFDTAGNHLSTVALTATVSPWSVIPWQGDILVATGLGAATDDDVHRYTLAGVSVGPFNNSTLSFLQQISQASDGNVWAAVFTTGVVAKLDATTGLQLSSFPASGARGVFELQNGNVLWTNGSGVHVYDVGTATSTNVFAGSCYMLSLLPTDVSKHKNYGTGCHSSKSNLFQLFPDVLAAKSALDGNALRFSLTAVGYVADWLPGAAAGLFVTPSGGAPIIANADSTTTTIAASAPIPVPGGTQASWTVSSNGVVTAGATGNQGTSGTPTLASTATATGLAFYTWANHNPAEAGSGKVTWEEIGNVLYVTFSGVEFNGGTPTLAPSTFQWQIDMTTGQVTMLWTSFSNSNSASDVLVGCTLAVAGSTPISETLSTVVASPMTPDGSLAALSLSASPAPVINPSTLVTYTIGNIPETAPGSGIYLSTLFLSVNPVPSGIDLTGILTTVPGCNLYVATLDVNIGTAVTFAPTNLVSVTFSTPVFAPGNVIGAQAVAFFDGAFPLLNGESSGFLFSNGVSSTTYLQ